MDAYIKRANEGNGPVENPITFDEWKAAFAKVRGMRPAPPRERLVFTDPDTGEARHTEGGVRDAEVFDPEYSRWITLFWLSDGSISFSWMSHYALPDDLVGVATRTLARTLDAKVFGPEGEVYG